MKKIERLIYIKYMDSIFNKEKPIKYTMKVNIYIYYKGHREVTEINVIREQKWK